MSEKLWTVEAAARYSLALEKQLRAARKEGEYLWIIRKARQLPTSCARAAMITRAARGAIAEIHARGRRRA